MIVLIFAIIVKPQAFSGLLHASVQNAAWNETSTVTAAQIPVASAVLQSDTVANQTRPQEPTPITTPPPPTRVYYSPVAVEVPRIHLPDNMDSFGSSDFVRWDEQELIPYAYLQESNGGITQEFNVPYDESIINITSVADRNAGYADLRMVVCDAKNGTILTGIEIFHGGSARKILYKPKNNIYIIVSSQYVDQFQITFEAPQKYYDVNQYRSSSEISGVSTLQLETNPSVKTLVYTLLGKNDHIDYQMYGGVSNYFPTPDQQTILPLINDDIQNYYLSDLVQKIKEKTNNRDDQARIAISMVQQLYYNYTKEHRMDNGLELPYNSYPYTTIYTDNGICEDKSILLAYLLKELGYGVVLLQFTPQNIHADGHMAIGVKAPSQYSAYTFNNQTYAYVETTCPNIVTYENLTVKSEKTTIIPIADGVSFDSIGQEYIDAKTLFGSPHDARTIQNYEVKYGLISLYPKEVCQYT